jgi:hypothetical protein
MFLALTLAVAGALVAGIAVLAYFQSTWFRTSFRHNAPHYLTAIFTLLLVVFACSAWLEARRGSEALEGQLAAIQLDQRPLLWIIRADRRPEYLDATHQFKWNWFFANIGKGIAYQAVFHDYLKIGSERYQRSRDFGSDAVISQPPPPTTLPPFVQLRPPDFLVQFHTAVSRPGIDKDFFNQQMNIDHGIGLLVEFDYADASGKTPFTNAVCIELLATGAIANKRPDECLIPASGDLQMW